MPTSAPPPPLLNRGANAWENVSRGSGSASVWLAVRHPEVQPVVTRAQVHAVNDTTNGVYTKVIFKALDAIERGVRAGQWPDPRTIEDLDAILSAVVDDFIYVQRLPRQTGQQLHAAWSHVFSNHIDRLPLFSRTVIGWGRIAPGGERFGLSEARWGAIARQLFLDATTPADWESALWWVTQKDVYGREQDLEGLRNTKEDVAVHTLPGGTFQVALFFGIGSRGESVKTSGFLPNQGTIIESQWVTLLFLDHLSRIQPGQPIFRVSRQQVQNRVKKACHVLKIDPSAALLHRLRHTGPANDIYFNRKDLEQARRRGRWLSIKSLERYTKVAHLVADLAELPPSVIRFGEEFLANPPSYIVHEAPQKSVGFSLS